MSEGAQTLHPDIPESGPRIRAGLSASTRESAEYWDHKPEDHAQTGLFLGGPEGEKVGWLRDIYVGDANTAPSHETREAALQRMAEVMRRKIRLITAIVSGNTGRNRNRRAA
jgi:hypothetical protein